MVNQPTDRKKHNFLLEVNGLNMGHNPARIKLDKASIFNPVLGLGLEKAQTIWKFIFYIKKKQKKQKKQKKLLPLKN